MVVVQRFLLESLHLLFYKVSIVINLLIVIFSIIIIFNQLTLHLSRHFILFLLLNLLLCKFSEFWLSGVKDLFVKMNFFSESL